jgi:hypothetical protein
MPNRATFWNNNFDISYPYWYFIYPTWVNILCPDFFFFFFFFFQLTSIRKSLLDHIVALYLNSIVLRLPSRKTKSLSKTLWSSFNNSHCHCTCCHCVGTTCFGLHATIIRYIYAVLKPLHWILVCFWYLSIDMKFVCYWLKLVNSYDANHNLY